MRYYCHHCHTQINADELLPDYTCPSCHSGFVEEIPVQASRRSSSMAGSDDGNPAFISTRMSSDDFSDDNSDVEFLDAVNGPLAQVLGLFQPQQQSTAPPPPNVAGQSSQQSDTPTTNTTNTPAATNTTQAPNRMLTRSVNRAFGRNPTQGQLQTAYLDSTANQSLADVLNDFITGVSFGTHFPEGTSSSGQGVQGASGSGPIPAARGLINIDFPLPFFLHSNPGDYAWGNAGFDAVITQLLNSLDGSNSGPAPMPKDQVDNLPTVKITDDQVKNSNLQCTVCMDDFQVGDSARQLPCEHFFHQDCILPWLNLHASCPICRKTFVNATNATQNPGSDSSNNEGSDANTTANPPQNTTNNPGTASAGNRGNASRTSSATVTNHGVAPNYDYTEDDCD